MDSLRNSKFIIVQDAGLTVRVQYRFPRSRRRRIRAKWAARACNFRVVPAPDIYHVPLSRTLLMHPATYKRLERELREAGYGG